MVPNLITSTFSMLEGSIKGLTVPGTYKIKVKDPENIILDKSTITGSLGYILKTNIKEDIIFDLSLTDVSLAKCNTLQSAFNGCTNLYKIGGLPYIQGLDNAEYCFAGCTNLVSANIDSFDDIFYADHLFDGCSSLENIRLTHLVNCRDFRYGLANCTSLKEVNVSLIQLAENVDYMLSGCSGLETLYTSDRFLTGLKSDASMLEGCSSLSNIIKYNPAIIDRDQFILGNARIHGALEVSDESRKEGIIVHGKGTMDELEVKGAFYADSISANNALISEVLNVHNIKSNILYSFHSREFEINGLTSGNLRIVFYNEDFTKYCYSSIEFSENKVDSITQNNEDGILADVHEDESTNKIIFSFDIEGIKYCSYQVSYLAKQQKNVIASTCITIDPNSSKTPEEAVSQSSYIDDDRIQYLENTIKSLMNKITVLTDMYEDADYRLSNLEG